MSDLGNKKIFAKNLNYYMRINNKDRNDVARDLDLPYTTITSWCKGEFYPRIDKIELLANYFEIKKSDLVEDKQNNNSHNSVPLYKKLSFNENVIDFDKSTFMKYITINDTFGYEYDFSNCFALVAFDDSMYPLLDIGDIAIIYKCNSFESGNTCLILLDNKDLLIRKIIDFKDLIELQTMFPFKEPQRLTKDEMIERNFTVLGRVIRAEISSAFK